MIAWRLVPARHLDTAMSGQGAKEFGGRWNSKGRPIVYASATPSQAILEILVHLPDYSRLLQDWSLLSMEFGQELVRSVALNELPPDWRTPDSQTLKRLGDAWLAEMESAVLEVPSAITVVEPNFLLNPLHPDFTRIRVNDPFKLAMDSRLIR